MSPKQYQEAHKQYVESEIARVEAHIAKRREAENDAPAKVAELAKKIEAMDAFEEAARRDVAAKALVEGITAQFAPDLSWLAEEKARMDAEKQKADWTSQACDESGCVVAGVGPEAPTVTNANGAKQSGSLFRCDLLPAWATLHVAGILKYGADKYGDNNWRGIPLGDHLNHALTHIFAHLAGDSQDDHLGHAACRLLMALEVAPRRIN